MISQVKNREIVTKLFLLQSCLLFSLLNRWVNWCTSWKTVLSCWGISRRRVLVGPFCNAMMKWIMAFESDFWWTSVQPLKVFLPWSPFAPVAIIRSRKNIEKSWDWSRPQLASAQWSCMGAFIEDHWCGIACTNCWLHSLSQTCWILVLSSGGTHCMSHTALQAKRGPCYTHLPVIEVKCLLDTWMSHCHDVWRCHQP